MYCEVIKSLTCIWFFIHVLKINFIDFKLTCNVTYSAHAENKAGQELFALKFGCLSPCCGLTDAKLAGLSRFRSLPGLSGNALHATTSFAIIR